MVEETAGGANLAFDAEGNAVNALEAKERLETATKQVNAAQTKISTIESERKTIAQTKENLSKQQATIQIILTLFLKLPIPLQRKLGYWRQQQPLSKCALCSRYKIYDYGS